MRRAVAFGLIVTLTGCTNQPSALVRLVGAEERAGVTHTLAQCVATAVKAQLGDNIVRQLAKSLDPLPPSLQASLTRITAQCAVTTVSITTPTTSQAPTSGAPTSGAPTAPSTSRP